MADDEHSHLQRVPEPLEKLFEELSAIEAVGGEAAKGDAAAVRATLQQALAAEARGDVAGAVAGITGAMRAIAALASRVDPREGAEMRAVADQFERALFRGDPGEAAGAAETMRERAGAKVVKPQRD